MRIPAEVVAAAAAFAVFAVLAAPGIEWMDPGELAAAAYTLGGAHPPGHPAHTLLGKLASLLPIGEIAFRINLLSAACMAAAVAGVVALARALASGPAAALAGGVAAALAILSPVVQTNATRTEVYAPVAALLLWAMVAPVRFCRARPGARDGRLVLGAALACGLAAAIHPVIAASAALPMAAARAAAAGGRLRRLAPAAIALGLLGLATYAYLVVRAHAASPPLLIWGDPRDAGSLWDLVRAPAYQGNFAVSGFFGRFGALLATAGQGMGVGLVAGGLAGLALALWAGPRAAAAVVLAAALAVIAGAATQESFNPDMPGYLLPALLLLAAGLAPLGDAAARALARRKTGGEASGAPGDRLPGGRPRAAAAAALVPVCALGLIFSPSGPAEGGARRGDDPLRLWDQTVARMPPGPAVYFARSDHTLFAAQYERLVAGGRPDVAVASPEMTRDRWFLQHVKRLVPALYVPYIDDGVRGELAMRLAVSNLRAGHPVGGDEPAFARLDANLAAPVGRGYLYALEPAGVTPGEEAREPPPFSGRVGARVAGDVGMIRALYEASRGRLAAAAVAAGLAGRFGDDGLAALAGAAPSAERPALYALVPRLGHVFVFEPWQRDLFGDDLAWVARLPIVALGDDAPAERRLHALWRGLLSGDATVTPDAIAAFGARAELSTARMLAALGRTEQAERQLRAAIARRPDEPSLSLLAGVLVGRDTPESLAEAEHLLARAAALAPGSAEPLVRLAVVQARQGKRDQAAASLTRALALEPGRRDAAAMLEQLAAPQ